MTLWMIRVATAAIVACGLGLLACSDGRTLGLQSAPKTADDPPAESDNATTDGDDVVPHDGHTQQDSEATNDEGAAGAGAENPAEAEEATEATTDSPAEADEDAQDAEAGSDQAPGFFGGGMTGDGMTDNAGNPGFFGGGMGQGMTGTPENPGFFGGGNQSGNSDQEEDDEAGGMGGSGQGVGDLNGDGQEDFFDILIAWMMMAEQANDQQDDE